MASFRLEVGKSYIKQLNNKTVLIRIVGMVDADTREYKEGQPRFFDDRGMMFNENLIEVQDGGKPRTKKVGSKFVSSRWKIIRIATSQDIGEYLTEIITITKKHTEDITKYIPVGHPEFKMKLGSVYVNRRGNLILIDRITHTTTDDVFYLSTNFPSDTNLYSWNSQGRMYRDVLSMKDIAFQRI